MTWTAPERRCLRGSPWRTGTARCSGSWSSAACGTAARSRSGGVCAATKWPPASSRKMETKFMRKTNKNFHEKKNSKNKKMCKKKNGHQHSAQMERHRFCYQSAGLVKPKVYWATDSFTSPAEQPNVNEFSTFLKKHPSFIITRCELCECVVCYTELELELTWSNWADIRVRVAAPASERSPSCPANSTIFSKSRRKWGSVYSR